ncbi:MAG: glycine--tRNA ligase subunit beta [Desulfobacteraceae bacterium 4484_190.2]|nr:MAG: glycine--tRNA ligase subunit beta [Desulfobacteraceae bacterium 4484_190.2]
MSAELLLEIGTEEIPSAYLEEGLNELRRLAEACLKENRIEVTGNLRTYGTPRRLVLIGKTIAEKQEDLVKEMTGPPKTVAYDKEGKPTKAAIGFARRQGVSVDELECIETAKGEYLFIKSKIPGRPARDILAEVLPKLVGNIPWPKSMRWGSVGFSFVRPVHWVLALLNGEVIPFEVAGVKSGNTTRGHRFMAPEVMKIVDVRDYFAKIEKSFVLVDQKEREQVVEKLVIEAAESVGGKPAKDRDLLSTVANLVEYPSAVCGNFDRSFLDVPEPVLITAMREHQKYFAVYDGEDRLMPNFVAVNNTIARDTSVVKRGHERVLRARLSDADFFFKEDLKRPLQDRLEDLKRVTYQADLGTSYSKVQRFSRLAEYLGGKVLPGKIEQIKIAASLCKCDLVSQMVTEFPSLQGVVGKVYARIEGQPEEVCAAIYEHYLPTKAGGQLPTSRIGAVVGLADRMDTIIGCFAVGLEPSGTADPFALRRHSLSIIRIVEDMGWDLSLKEFIERGLSISREEVEFDKGRVFAKISDFFKERYKQMMLRSDYETDLIEAAISVEFDRINDLRLRIEQLKRFATESSEFHDLALTFKRVTNILKKQEKTFEVDTNLFKETSESVLWKTFQALKDDVYGCLGRKDYYGALGLMLKLRKPVDDFFDEVEILTKENEALKANRVGILQQLSRLFLSVADLSKFSI